jgi:hypothetical protein
MTDRVLIAANGVWLSLTVEQFEGARVAAQDFVPAATATTVASSAELLTAEQLEQRTSVPASWWETAAREGRVPHRRIGRYTRFLFAEVEQAFRPLDSDSLSHIRQWRRSAS